MTTWLGLDAGHEDPATADAVALALHESLLYDATVVCVHVVDQHHALSFRLDAAPSENTLSTLIERGYGVAVHNGDLRRLAGPEELHRGALRAALAHRDRREGRALRFPGQRVLRGRYGVSDILAFSEIDEVLPHGVKSVDARGDLQPSFRDGRLVLTCAQPG
ncbi:hypothetical protein [Saccharothrix coeruleofusca]|uniref:Uncharacterized protein n=1 Tax=Saccharothrix coeruleofusca TaxID=33919 RepID=A0A918AM08_9PSEU|nr:hypothetical protein [Saccharothrix coeruleofusca]MBP2339248.1 hypothetical protein [Saccharothrix coeruleofusca]GGP59110.1 hypothetical protein GCM10010185_34500 [Saccharothrix coeruleofusca]